MAYQNWWDDDEPMGSPTMQPRSQQPIQAPARQPAPQTAPQAALDAARLTTEELRQRTLRQGIEMRDRTMRGEQPLTPAARNEMVGAYNSLNNLERGIDEIGGLYQQSFSGRNPAEYLSGPLYPASNQLNEASGRLAAFIANALELSGQQFNTPREQQLFIQSYLPSNSDTDESMQGKIAALSDLLNNARRSMAPRLGMEFQEYVNPLDRPQPELPSQERMTALGPAVAAPGQGGQTELSTTTETVQNPALAGLNSRIDQFVRSNEPVGTVARTLREMGIDNAGIVDITNQYRRLQTWRRQHPEYQGPFRVDLEKVERQLDPLAAAAARTANSPLGAYGMAAGQAVTGNRLDEAAGFMGGNAEQARAGMAGVRENNPLSSLMGDISGQGLAMAGGQAAARAAMTRAPGVISAAMNPFTRTAGRQALAGDAAYGAYAGSGDDNLLLGTAANMAGGAAGSAAMRGAGRVVGGARDLAVRELTDRGVPLTLGQIAGQGGLPGRMLRSVEQRAAGMPVIGDMIGGQYRQGLEAGVQQAHQEVLNQIGERAGPLVGEEAMDATSAQVSAAFRQATQGVNLRRDRQFNAQFRSAIMAGRRRAIPPEQRTIVDAAMTQIGELFENNNMSGQNLQAALQILGEARSAVAGQPLSRASLASLRQAEQAIVNMTRRQSPDTMPALNRARQAYRRLAVVRDATRSARNDANGVFTPAQLNTADVTNTTNYGGRNASASTRRPFYELGNAARQVLPNRIPDSGTAGRAALGGAGLVGAGYGSDQAGLTDNGTGLALGLGAAGVGLPYTNLGRAGIQKALASRPESFRRAGDQLIDNEWLQYMARLIGASQLPNQTTERY